jgi:HSP20 family protein
MFGLIPWTRRERNGGALMPVNRLGNEFEAMFDRFFRNWMVPFEGATYPEWYRELNVEETEKEYVIRAEVPGFEAAEFNIHVTGNTLTMKAEHKEEPEAKRGYGYLERHFERTVTLPPGTNPEMVEAGYRNGVLEVHVPKVEEAKARKIEVKT